MFVLNRLASAHQARHPRGRRTHIAAATAILLTAMTGGLLTTAGTAAADTNTTFVKAKPVHCGTYGDCLKKCRNGRIIPQRMTLMINGRITTGTTYFCAR